MKNVKPHHIARLKNLHKQFEINARNGEPLAPLAEELIRLHATFEKIYGSKEKNHDGKK